MEGENKAQLWRPAGSCREEPKPRAPAPARKSWKWPDKSKGGPETLGELEAVPSSRLEGKPVFVFEF